MRWEDLIEKTPYRLAQNGHPRNKSLLVSRVVTEAEEAREDTLYVCLCTATWDGHPGAARAYGNGCRLFLAQRSLLLPADATVLVVESTKELLGPMAAMLLGHPARKLTVLGVTGSVGKTCVADTVATVLHRLGRRVACVTTDGVRVGDRSRPRRDILPTAAELQMLLHEFVQEGIEVVILELSSYMLTQGLAFSIPFTAVLLTNLFPDHGEGSACGSARAYVQAMASLFAEDAAFQIFPINSSLPMPLAGMTWPPAFCAFCGVSLKSWSWRTPSWWRSRPSSADRRRLAECTFCSLSSSIRL